MYIEDVKESGSEENRRENVWKCSKSHQRHQAYDSNALKVPKRINTTTKQNKQQQSKNYSETAKNKKENVEAPKEINIYLHRVNNKTASFSI